MTETEVHYWRARFGRETPNIGVRTFFGPPLMDGEYLDRAWRWQAVVRLETSGRVIEFGEPCPIQVEGVNLRNIERIDAADYRYMVDHADYATKYRPDLPDAAPKTRIDKRGKSVW